MVVELRLIDRHGIAKRMAIEVNGKLVTTPCYISKIQSDFEMDIFCKLSHSLNSIRGLFYDIHNVEDIIKKHEANIGQRNIFMEVIKNPYEEIKGSLPVFIDPCTEYFYLKSWKREKFLRIRGLPHSVRQFLLQSNTEKHSRYWRAFMEDEEFKLQYADWFLRYQSKNFADVIIPPVPYISGKDERLVDYAIEMNEYTLDLSSTYEKDCALYFLVSFKVFEEREKREQLELILDYLFNNLNRLSATKLLFIKIKGYNIDKSFYARRTIRDIKTALYELSESSRKAIFLIDTRTLGYVCSASGLDGFVEPMSGSLNEFGGGKIKNGSIYVPGMMEFVPYDNFREIHEANGNRFPFSTRTSEALNGIPLDEIQGWNTVRRATLLENRNQEVNELHDMISDHNSRGISEKIQRSKRKNYLDLIPNGFV